MSVITTASPSGADEQTAPTEMLRYGYQYNFTHSFINDVENKTGVKNVNTTFSEQGDFNNAQNPDFSWTPEFEAQGFLLDAGERAVMIRSTSYEVLSHPEVRDTENLVIKYTTAFMSEVGSTWVDREDNIHTQSYEITWCGDGTIDRYLDQSGYNIFEQCDPSDQSKTEWGVLGCSATCEALD